MTAKVIHLTKQRMMTVRPSSSDGTGCEFALDRKENTGYATGGLRSSRPIPAWAIVAASRLLRSASVPLLPVVAWFGADAFGYRRAPGSDEGSVLCDEIIR